LIVIDGRDRHAFAADLAARQRVVGVESHQRRHVERGRQTGLTVREQVAEAAVRILGRPESGKHPHRPGLAAVHAFVGAAGEREPAGVPQLLGGVPVGIEVPRVIDGRQRQPGLRLGGRRILGPNPNGFAV
jgi:hypothetical protein